MKRHREPRLTRADVVKILIEEFSDVRRLAYRHERWLEEIEALRLEAGDCDHTWDEWEGMDPEVLRKRRVFETEYRRLDLGGFSPGEAAEQAAIAYPDSVASGAICFKCNEKRVMQGRESFVKGLNAGGE